MAVIKIPNHIMLIELPYINSHRKACNFFPNCKIKKPLVMISEAITHAHAVIEFSQLHTFYLFIVGERGHVLLEIYYTVNYILYTEQMVILQAANKPHTTQMCYFIFPPDGLTFLYSYLGIHQSMRHQ